MNTTSTRALPGPGGKVGLLINRNYGLLFTGQMISLIGDQVSTYTMLLWIITIIIPGRTWAPLVISGLMVAGMVPDLLVGPLAGVFVDRWNRRLTMLNMDAIRAVLMTFLLAFTGIVPLPFLAQGHISVELQLVAIITVVFLTSVCAQFFSPAYIGLIAEIVPDEHRSQAIGLGQTMTSLAIIIGPPLAAPLLFNVGIQWALIIDILSYIVSLLTLSAIRSSSMPASISTRSDVRSEFIEGLRFSFSNRLIRMVIITSAIAAFGAGAFSSLYIFFVQQNLHTNVKLVGFIGTFLGAGTIIGALVTGKFANYIGAKRTLYGSLLLSGMMIVVLSRLTSFTWALLIVFLLGFLLASLRVATVPLVLKETPTNMIGRVVSVMNPATAIVTLLVTPLAGYLAGVVLVGFHWNFHWILSTTFGPIDTIFVGVGCTFFLAALYTYFAFAKNKGAGSDL